MIMIASAIKEVVAYPDQLHRDDLRLSILHLLNNTCP